MVAIRQRHNKWEAKVRVPGNLQEAVGRDFLYRTLTATSRHGAKVEAAVWEAGLRTAWAALSAERDGTASPAILRATYKAALQEAVSGELRVEMMGVDTDPALLGIEWEIDKIVDTLEPDGEPSATQAARLAALSDAADIRRGRPT